MQQEKPFEEIDLWMKKTYVQENGHPFKDLIKQLKEDGELKETEIKKSKKSKNGK
jgi:hypothetical protein